MKTNRLYYSDAYLTDFEAVVTDIKTTERGVWLALDRSAFYPTSGGQPHDTGTITARGARLNVMDVEVENDVVWHLTDGALSAGEKVSGHIDRERRMDHMEQHGGEHLLAGSIWHLFRGVTRGLHVGKEFSTIDVLMPEGQTRLSDKEHAALEDLVNARIREDAPIRCWFPDREELARLPLRKPSSVKENVRVVAAGDFEMVPCGGTHPKSTGCVGLMKVISTAPARGFMRVTFAAGARAVRYVREMCRAAQAAGDALSCPPGETAEQICRMAEEKAALSSALRLCREREAARAAALLPKEEFCGVQISFGIVEDFGGDLLRAAASALVKEKGRAALLLSEGEKGFSAVFAASLDVPADMQGVMRACGARGGGKPDFAQGRADNADVLVLALAALKEQLGSNRSFMQ